MAAKECQKFDADCKVAVNEVVNIELGVSYNYLSMSCHFDRDDIALDHMAKFLKKKSQDSWEHAEKLLKYQNKRGGHVVLQDIQPGQDEWDGSLDALEKVLHVDAEVNQVLLYMHVLATEKGDPHSCHFNRDDVALSHVAKFLEQQSQEMRGHAAKFLKYQNKRAAHGVLQAIKKAEQNELVKSLETLDEALKLEGKVNQIMMNLHKLVMEKVGLSEPGWGNCLETVEMALGLEKEIVQSLQYLRRLATENGDPRKPERDEWGSSLEALEKALQLEKKVNMALLDLHKLAMEKGDPHLCDFLESEYLEEQVKAIKQLEDHLTNLRHLGVPQSGMGEYLFDRLTLGLIS
ncbi:uncharacterized protein LOC128328507 isoform X2 [Hemicordylus capensis]|uniref:uncharacterized protein LOC128328507 isoform X2 n=1 Tax=Hemicordylus capensis TaxID=884348 RepID=UPI002303FCAA|nr:uncharacterized protein LOC128328507 isoform X2 [Hemicordylus capensis]